MSEFRELVTLADDGELRASTEVIAVGMEYEHRAVLQLLRKYTDLLSRFGGIAFQMRTFETEGGTQQRGVAYLNEQQAALLISLMRNKPCVVEFKANLVAEFFRMREALRNRETTCWERRLALEVRDAQSGAKGRLGSKLMNERKDDLKTIRPDRAALKLEMEPGLFKH